MELTTKERENAALCAAHEWAKEHIKDFSYKYTLDYTDFCDVKYHEYGYVLIMLSELCRTSVFAPAIYYLGIRFNTAKDGDCAAIVDNWAEYTLTKK